MPQLLLFSDPRPLVERLGLEFFRELPERPGVYLMRDAVETVLYIGKAKNLRQRLGHYRVANPDRMPRRHLRLLRAVTRIELQECPDEAAALARESALLLELKPRFNRAGTWPSPPWYLAWRWQDHQLEFVVTEVVEAGWQSYGPRGRRSLLLLRSVLARLLWCVLRPGSGLAGIPPGWVPGRFGDRTILPLAAPAGRIVNALEKLFSGAAGDFITLVRRSDTDLHPFELAARAAGLEDLAECLRLEVEPVDSIAEAGS